MLWVILNLIFGSSLSWIWTLIVLLWTLNVKCWPRHLVVFVSFEPNSMYFDLCIKISRGAISILLAPVACDPIVLSLYDGIFVLTLSSVKFNRPSFCFPPPRSVGASSGLTRWPVITLDTSHGPIHRTETRHQERGWVQALKTGSGKN